MRLPSDLSWGQRSLMSTTNLRVTTLQTYSAMEASRTWLPGNYLARILARRTAKTKLSSTSPIYHNHLLHIRQQQRTQKAQLPTTDPGLTSQAIYPGARVTVLQACYCLLTHKLSNNFGDVALDELLRLLHEVILPEGHLLPPSLYLLRKVIGCSSWWVERLVQSFKAAVDGKVVKDVEKTCDNRALDRDALMALRAQRPDLKVFDELVLEYRSLPIAGPTVDDGAADGNQTLGKGQVVKCKGKVVAMTAVLDHVKKYTPVGWDEAAVQQAFADGRVLRYTRADKCGDEIIISTQYGRSSTRHIYWVEVQLKDKVRGSTLRTAFIRKCPESAPRFPKLARNILGMFRMPSEIGHSSEKFGMPYESARKWPESRTCPKSGPARQALVYFRRAT
jgi:hypothetical protein